MSNSTPPEGWDEEIDPALIEGVRELRKMFLAFLTVGFTVREAATIIAAMVGQSIESSQPNG